MSRIEAPWDRPLEANHIVNVPPANQKSWGAGRQFLMAGLDSSMPNNGNNANAWYNVSSDFGPTAGARVETAKFKIYGKATSNDGSDFPIVPLYGVIGTNEEGWAYDPSTRMWYKDAPDIAGTGATGPVTTYPPGPTQGGAPTAKATQAIEFSVSEDSDGFWIARTPASSAAVKDGNPHPGISIINPGEWERVTGGMSKREALSLDEFKDAGWKGLDRPFLAWQGTDSQPAGEELGSAMTEATKGDKGALRALRSVGISPPDNLGDDSGDSGLFGSLGFKF